MLGQNILTYTHPEDHVFLKQQIVPTNLETLFEVHSGDDADEGRVRTQEEEDEIDRKLKADKRKFTIR